MWLSFCYFHHSFPHLSTESDIFCILILNCRPFLPAWATNINFYFELSNEDLLFIEIGSNL